MNRIFLRFVVLVLLSITAATGAIYLTISVLFGDPVDETARRQAAGQIFLLEQYVDQAPADEWLARLNKVREVSTVRYDLIGLAQARAALPAAAQAALERGALVMAPADKAFYRRVDLRGERYIGSDQEVLRASGLPIDLAHALQVEALRFAIIALALLVPIAWWSRAHWQSLLALSRVADAIGAGQLDARAPLRPSDALYPLAERIHHMAARISALLAAQRTLLHSVSHELRTPIARLEFGLELLDGLADNPALRKRIAAMEGDLAELDKLVSELLGMARLDDAAALQRAPFALAPMLHDCVAALPPAPAAVNCAADAALGDCNGDRRLLMRAVGNLLRNAQKYADSTVTLTAARLAGGALEIVVEDDGPGIPADERDKVFEPFYRLDRSRDRATGGFGLGLSIAARAVALHGGSLTVEDAAPHGARFVLRLPQDSGGAALTSRPDAADARG